MEVLNGIDLKHMDSLRRRGEFFWLDLHEPAAGVLDSLATHYGWHPVVRQNLADQHQRPKLASYGDYSFLVFYGARKAKLARLSEQPDDAHLVEVHLVVSGDYVISIHRRPLKELDDLRESIGEHEPSSEEGVIYEILDALTNTYFDVLDDIDTEIDDLEDAIVARPTEDQLEQVFHLKRVLIRTRRAVDPQRDLAARALDDLERLPGLQTDGSDYFRQVYDHLLRISDRVEAYRDLLTSVMDVYLSTVSNRLNVVMKQLTIVATIFLPLTFVTGFFGMNFSWLVTRITGPFMFFALGIGLLLAPIVAMLVWFRRKGWLGDGEAPAPTTRR
ncbi:MAG: magnesium/cobalt transporter CorA [Solirubrobacteraceae bacterium]